MNSLSDLLTRAGPLIAAGIALAALAYNRRWYRRQASFTFFNPLSLDSLENDLDQLIRLRSREIPLSDDEVRLLRFQHKLPQNDPATAAIVDSVRNLHKSIGIYYRDPPMDASDVPEDSDPYVLVNQERMSLRRRMREAGRKLRTYFNEVEKYCLAILDGAVDSDIARSMYFHRFRKQYLLCEGFVAKIKADKDSPLAYDAFHYVVFAEWEPRQNRWWNKRASHWRIALHQQRERWRSRNRAQAEGS